MLSDRSVSPDIPVQIFRQLPREVSEQFLLLVVWCLFPSTQEGFISRPMVRLLGFRTGHMPRPTTRAPNHVVAHTGRGVVAPGPRGGVNPAIRGKRASEYGLVEERDGWPDGSLRGTTFFRGRRRDRNVSSCHPPVRRSRVRPAKRFIAERPHHIVCGKSRASLFSQSEQDVLESI